MIGEALRLIRVFHDTSLTELAKDFDVSPSYLSEVENEKRNANLDLIQRYAKKFGIRPSAIMFFAEEIDRESLAGKAKSSIRDKMMKLMQSIEKYGYESKKSSEM